MVRALLSLVLTSWARNIQERDTARRCITSLWQVRSIFPVYIGTIAGLPREEMNKHNGIRSVFYGAFFVFNIQTTIACFSETSKRSYVKIKRIEDVDMQALFMYDAPQCLALNDTLSGLSKWFRMIGSHARVAIDSEGIVGYTVARPTFIKESYKIGPLYADSGCSCIKLLKPVFEELLRQEKRAPVVCIDAHTEKASKLCKRLQGKR